MAWIPLSQSLVDHAKQLAQQADAPFLHFETKPDKKKLVHKLLRERPREDGLVAVLCCKEHCRTVKLLHGNQWPRLAFRRQPQRVLYFYFLDDDFGLMHVRVQTLFPFTCQIYVNGHEWLARQMQKRRIGFVQADNAFLDIDDFDHAQELADQFSKLDWVKIPDRFVQPVNPLLEQPWLGQRSYRWVIDQAEYSTDLLFLTDRHATPPRKGVGRPSGVCSTTDGWVLRGTPGSFAAGIIRGYHYTHYSERLSWTNEFR